MIKSFLILTSTLLLSNIAIAQKTEIGIGFAGYFATQRPANIDVKSAGGLNLSVTRNFHLKNNWSVQPSLQLGNVSYNMDGNFNIQNGKYLFEISPDNHKQDILKYYYVKLPLLLKYGILTQNSKPFVYLGFGPYLEYMVNPMQYYKIGINSYSMKSPIQNKFNYGMTAELSLYGRSDSKNPISLNVGCSYQMSNYLNDANSFKPFSPFIRLGVGF